MLATALARGNLRALNQLLDIKARIENTLSTIRMNETSFLGVLGQDADACYAGPVQKMHTEANTEKIQITAFATRPGFPAFSGRQNSKDGILPFRLIRGWIRVGLPAIYLLAPMGRLRDRPSDGRESVQSTPPPSAEKKTFASAEQRLGAAPQSKFNCRRGSNISVDLSELH